MALELVELTEEEIAAKGLQLAEAMMELWLIQDEKKESMNNYKFRLESQQKLINALTKAINSGEEMRARSMFDGEEFDEL